MKPGLDWRSAALSCTADPDWRVKIWRGGWLLLLPFVGWPLALGYRRLFVGRLLDGARPLLPEWRGQHAFIARQGLAAMAVIHLWYCPLYAWIAYRTWAWDLGDTLPWLGILAGMAAFGIFSTMIVPGWLLWMRLAPGSPASWQELLAIGLTFTAITFVIPSGFLNVSRTRRIVSAFDLPRALRRIRAQPRRYVEAWLGSSLLSLPCHLFPPLAPWAVIWVYLAIVHAFNEVPWSDEAADEAAIEKARPGERVSRPGAWYTAFRQAHWGRYRIETSRWIETYRPRSPADSAPVIGDLATSDPDPANRAGASFRALRLGPLRWLLPGGPP